MSHEIHVEHLVNSLGKLLDSGRHSDLTIICQDGTEYAVHKTILCARSDVFERECEIQMVEGRTNVIKHEQFDSDTVGRMIAYLYRNHYDLDERITSSHGEATSGSAWQGSHAQDMTDINERLKAHIRVYAIADFYNIEPLRKLAVLKFSDLAQKEWAIDTFVGVIQEVCALTGPANRDMRDAVMSVAIRHQRELVQHCETMKCLAEGDGLQEFLVILFANVVDPHEGNRRKRARYEVGAGPYPGTTSTVSIWDPLEQADEQSTAQVVGWDDYDYDS